MDNKEPEFKEILDNIADGVYFVDRDRRITYWNKGAEQISGYSAKKVVGLHCMDNLLNHVTENGIQLCLNGCPLHATMQDGKNRTAEVYLHHADGHRVPVQVRTSPIRDENNEIIGAVETFSDNSPLISIRHQVRRLEDVTLLDHLTGIGNRRFMERRLEMALLEFQQRHTPFGILFMDIDRFKWVNDTFGHDNGDKALRMVANNLRLNLRVEDAIARWGGEEFVALLEGMDTRALGRMADKLDTLIANSPLQINDSNITITISIGATLILPQDTDIQSIISRADQNMYKNKLAGPKHGPAPRPRKKKA